MLKHVNSDHFDANKQDIPSATTLLSEALGLEDLDTNTYVYVRDFVINEYDSAKPIKLLTAIEPTDINEIPYISWEDYKEWTDDETGTIPEPVAPAIIWFNKYVLKLVQEAKTGIDKDGNNKVFVTDFKFNITVDLPDRLKTYQESSTATRLINFSQYVSWIDGGPDPLNP